MTSQFSAQILDTMDGISLIKIPKLQHSDVLCLYAIVAASNYSDKEINNTINLLLSDHLISSEAKAIYEEALLSTPSVTISDFYDNYNLPPSPLQLISGKYSLSDRQRTISSHFLKTKNPTPNFVACFTWYNLLFFGAPNVKLKIKEAREHFKGFQY